ncbi:hypothetical protein IV203_008021 [Nitzschia inconspicua]|uniref:RING-type E3 ubiquitin transferase n=1 Tax=Nitzschia inconspicua TaxID=303405 RepID=A0A9K3PLR8_9STRA|nr:hypothetical protein IV203_008021 [Nitzschia inconspicua]
MPELDDTRGMLATESNSPDSDSTIEVDLIPESLLALAKDARYIQQCQELLIQSVESLSLLLGGNNSRLQISTKQSCLLSYVLYGWCVVVPLGRTLGMKATGLEFQKPTYENFLQPLQLRRRLLGSLLLTACVGGWIMNNVSTRTSDVQGDLTSTEGTRQQESLHGRDRRQAHERLRQQMLARASVTAGAEQQPDATTQSLQITGNSATVSISTQRSSSIRRKIKSMLRHLCGSILDAGFHSEGPHAVPDIAQATISYSIAVWIIRLHLAQFLITGKYPTIFHRLLGLKLQSNRNTIPFRPSLQRFIGVSILLQGTITFIRATSNGLARMVARWLEQRRQQSISTFCSLSSRRELENELGKYFENHPYDERNQSETFLRSDESESDDAGGRVGVFYSHDQQRNSVCTICRMERVHSAAPVSCGHVCCWNCLIHWVQNVRPECPLCRAPCRPQEIIALHHYEPEKTTDSDGLF